LMFSGLLSIQKRLGKDKFPLIVQYYYPNSSQMRFTPDYPLVLKVGHVHAGFGKMLLQKHENFEDFASVVALHDDYSTAERFLDGEYDLRIQKIGNQYRAYKRQGVNWKTNVGTAILDDIPMTEQYKLWVDEASKLFGGMDILAVDAIHNRADGKDYILEVNDSAIGLGPQHEDDDMLIIRDLTMERMRDAFSKRQATQKEKFDTTGLYKKLEVELINARNSRIEVEKDVKQSNKRVQELQAANTQWKTYTQNYFKKFVTLGVLTGFCLGALLGFMTARAVIKFNIPLPPFITPGPFGPIIKRSLKMF